MGGGGESERRVVKSCEIYKNDLNLVVFKQLEKIFVKNLNLEPLFGVKNEKTTTYCSYSEESKKGLVGCMVHQHGSTWLCSFLKCQMFHRMPMHNPTLSK